ncbi:rifin [Plasmodium reichenowi]|uniref:Rifin n=1 Tax=Plasmodium reichenowi TaxID=5854 RepID=A0A151L235_PLARE|nr:rifin [Plasmodium reichenowi]KYN93025.1 rifin [Plasmodium reichenowi]
MKVHYTNILLFYLPLNILEHNKNKSYTTPEHTRNTRLLCECELYTSIYDDDPEMKKVLHDFDRQTSQRFKEYYERMLEKRKKCKEQCDKDIQKIILKDKIEKELTEKLSVMQTDITNDDIPTCACEKSLADKVEKGCLKCTQNLGGGIAELGLSSWKTAALAAAKKAAIAEGAVKGLAKVEAMGFAKFIEGMESAFCIKDLNINLLKSVFMQQNSANFSSISNFIYKKYEAMCASKIVGADGDFVFQIDQTLKGAACSSQVNVSNKASIATKVNTILSASKNDAAYKAADIIAEKTAEIETAKKVAIETTCMNCHTAIIASIVAILVIVLVMVIIYLILRYRRKKKMKKKLQYIKLLKE